MLVPSRETLGPHRADGASERLGEHRALGGHPVGDREQGGPRYGDALGEDPRTVHPDQAPARTEVLLARGAPLAGAAADQRVDRVAIRAQARDGLVSEHERGDAWARMPAVGVQVRAADPRELDVDDDFFLPRTRAWQLGVFERLAAVPEECLHHPPGSGAGLSSARVSVWLEPGCIRAWRM